MVANRLYTIYILRCSDGSFYTGITNNLKHRLAVHAAGKAAKYTRARLPVELVWCRSRQDSTKARKLEWAIKQLSRQQKYMLIADNTNLWKHLRTNAI